MTNVFPYSWHTYEENSSLGIRIFGMTEKNESVFVLATGFTPYVYLELPDNVTWTTSRVQTLSRKIDEASEKSKPIQNVFQRKKNSLKSNKQRMNECLIRVVSFK